MSMAGYWFDQQQAARFSRDWAKDLEKIGISHAHMTDCALGFGEYKSLSLQERIRAQTLLIEHIKRRSRFGFGVCISPSAYNEAMRDVRGAPSCYTLCLLLCVNKITDFARAIGYSGKLAYFFEAGHEKANEAHKFMNFIPSVGEQLADFHKYAGHAFVEKTVALPLQAADMFAWQLRHYFDRCIDGHIKPRRDYKALVRPFDFQVLVSGNHILALRELFRRIGPLFPAGDPEQVIRTGDEVMRLFGLSQLPIAVPRNTAHRSASEKPIVRY
jgi:hypothetical protein